MLQQECPFFVKTHLPHSGTIRLFIFPHSISLRKKLPECFLIMFFKMQFKAVLLSHVVIDKGLIHVLSLYRLLMCPCILLKYYTKKVSKMTINFEFVKNVLYSACTKWTTTELWDVSKLQNLNKQTGEALLYLLVFVWFGNFFVVTVQGFGAYSQPKLLDVFQ